MLIEIFNTIDPWIWVTIGAMLIAGDLLFGAAYVSILGFALVVNGLSTFVGLGTSARLILIFASLIAGWKMYRSFAFGSSQAIHDEHLDFENGGEGKIIWVDEESSDQGRAAIHGKGEWMVRSSDGKPLSLNIMIEVEKRVDSTLLVKKKEL